MKEKITAIAYPTIPIIFLGGIKPDRTPIYDTMGLAVTNTNETTRTETTIEICDSIKTNSREKQVQFYLGDKELTGLRGKQIINTIEAFLRRNNIHKHIRVRSENYDIFSGSSDSGLAALFTALNELFSCNYSKDELLKYSMKGSESAGRSLFGGLTLTKVTASSPEVVQLASEKDLAPIRLFAVPFHYNTRVSADEIHKTIVANPNYQKRIEKIPYWVKSIKKALQAKNFLQVLAVAEENIRNAHQLLEEMGLIVRRPEMMQLCKDISQMRKEGLPGYYLIGGGNLVTIATLNAQYAEIEKYLQEKGWTMYDYKVASAPRIV